jgi:hypothetical protein
MEEKKITKNGLLIQFGLILTIASIVYTLVVYYSGNLYSTWAQYPTYIIIAAIIFFAQKKLAEISGNEGLSYGKALGFGVMLSIVSAIFLVIFNYLFYAVIAPEAIQQGIDFAEQALLERGLPDDQVEIALEMQKKFMTTPYMVGMGLVGTVLIGLVISLITSIITKKEPQIFSE